MPLRRSASAPPASTTVAALAMLAVTCVLLAIACTFLAAPARADEGMWPPYMLDKLPFDSLRARGLELTAEADLRSRAGRTRPTP